MAFSMRDTADGIRALSGYTPEELLAILKEVLQEQVDVLQELCQWAVPDLVYGSARALTERRLRGVIKSFNEVSGYGFVSSPEIAASFGKDLFLSSHQLGGFGVGSEVSCAVLLNKGKLQAFDLAPLSAPRSRIPPNGKGAGPWGGGGAAWGGGAGAWGGGGGGWDTGPEAQGWGGPIRPPPPPWAAAPPSGGIERPSWEERHAATSSIGGGAAACGAGAPQRTPLSAALGAVGAAPITTLLARQAKRGAGGTRYSGSVKSFGQRTGYGFIACPELLVDPAFGKDVFVHAGELGGFEVGALVSFALAQDDRGKPMAVDLTPAAVPGAAPGAGGAAAPAGEEVPAQPKRPRLY